MKTKEEYKQYFEGRDFSGLCVDFGPNGKIQDAQILVNNHLPLILHNWGKPRFRPYVIRLLKVKEAYEKQNN